MQHRTFKVRYQTIKGYLLNLKYKSLTICADCTSDAEYAVSLMLGSTSYDIDAIEI